jgi:hypothetical protein
MIIIFDILQGCSQPDVWQKHMPVQTEPDNILNKEPQNYDLFPWSIKERENST